MQPFVSIIIPVFNGSDYLADAIDSALAQTYEHCEVIVINDGSTDQGLTESIALSYGQKIKYICKGNGGVGSALNVGIKNMRGDFFSWLSHDDLYLPEKITTQMKTALRCPPGAPVTIWSDFEYIRPDGSLIFQHISSDEIRPDDAFDMLFNEGNINGCTLLISRSAFELAGLFSEQLKTTQDYDLWFRMCRLAPFIKCPGVAVRSRVHDNQGSRTQKTHSAEQRTLFKRYLPEYLDQACANAPVLTYNQCMITAICRTLSIRIRQRHYGAALDTFACGCNMLKTTDARFSFILAMLRQLPAAILREISWLLPAALRNSLVSIFKKRGLS